VASSSEPTLDLHGLRVQDAVRRTTVFLVAEQGRGTAVVRIVTGQGTGAVKSAIRDLLRTHPAVATARPALHTDAAMLVVLRPRPR
jgi:DNA-nicking Smr family endonuclease